MNYHEKVATRKTANILKIKDILPPCCGEFLDSKHSNGNIDTIEAYAEDMKIFYEFFSSKVSDKKPSAPAEVSPEDFRQLRKEDLNRFVDYLSSYSNNNRSGVTNSRESKRHKLVVVKQFYKFLAVRYNVVNDEIIHTKSSHLLPKKDPATTSEAKKTTEINAKSPLYQNLSRKQQEINNRLCLRDRLLCNLYFTCEISAIEIAGIDTKDVDLDNRTIYISKKDGRQEERRMTDAIEKDMSEYLLNKSKGSRASFEPEDNEALFISRKTHKRMSSRTILFTVKKYDNLQKGGSHNDRTDNRQDTHSK